MKWSQASDIKKTLEKLWNNGTLLREKINSSDLFPLSLPLKRPSSQAILNEFDEVRQWVQQLVAHSHTAGGVGYEIEWEEINHRQLGRNQIPLRVIVPTLNVALSLIEKQQDASRFSQHATDTLSKFPMLRAWVMQHPLSVVQYHSDWPLILVVLDWFLQRPRSQIYLRQIDIPGIDTKFIETRKGLLAELLDQILPAAAVDTQYKPGKQFELRYGLNSKPVQIRFRILDSRYYLQGLADIAVPVEQLAQCVIPIKRVFITENDINGLAFPDVADSLVIFGLGYGLDALAKIQWLKQCEMRYWGDIDTHGFAILNRLRTYFPHAHSMLMDRNTLLAYPSLWGSEDELKRFTGSLPLLMEDERLLFEDIKHNRLGQNIRLEQERIPFHELVSVLL